MKIPIEKEKIFRIIFLLENEINNIIAKYPDKSDILNELKNNFTVKYIIKAYEESSK